MAIDVKIRFRSFLPGHGYNSGGSAKQGKTNVRGRIEVTSYTKGGEALTPQDLGLNTIDDLTLNLEEPMKGNDPAQTVRAVYYSRSAQQFYAATDNAEDAGAAAFNMTFDAFGDSAHDIELL